MDLGDKGKINGEWNKLLESLTLINEHDMRELTEAIKRIDKKVHEFEQFYTQGLQEVGRLSKAVEGLDATIKDTVSGIMLTVSGLISQAAGIIPGGLIPVRSAIIMLLVALGLTNAGTIGTHLTHIIHLLMGVQ